VGKAFAVESRLVGCVQAGKAKLRCGEFGLRQLDGRVLTCVDAFLHDANQCFGEACLLADNLLPLLVVVEREKGQRGVLGDGLADVVESKLGGVDSGFGRTDVGDLRGAVDQRASGDSE